MSSERRIVRGNHRRTVHEKLQQALSSKPTQDYLRRRGLTTQQLQSANLGNRPPALQPLARPTLATRPVSVQRPPPGYPAPAVLFTGGIGDILALESFMPDIQRTSMTTICYATRARKGIQELFAAAHSRFHNLAQHVVVWEDFRNIFAFFSKRDVYRHVRSNRLGLPQNWEQVNDWSIGTIFPRINDGTLKYNKSTFLERPIASIDHLGLPEKYCVVCPYTINDKRESTRDFDAEDWAATLSHLENINLPAVILNTGEDKIPEHPLVIDLSNKTTMPEAVEVLKKGQGYFGIDSSLSVLATKLFNTPNLVVKSRNGHLFANQHIYYAPQTDYGFIRSRMEF